MIDLSQLAGFLGVPVIIALVQVAKLTAPKAPDQAWPLVTLGVAVLWNVGLAALMGSPLGIAAAIGVVVGLTASGLYSHATVLTGVKP